MELIFWTIDSPLNWKQTTQPWVSIEKHKMGNLTHWLILGGIILCCIVVVAFSLLSRHRSWIIAIPTGMVLALSLTAIVLSPMSLSKITIFLTIGAAAGLVRQFRSIH